MPSLRQLCEVQGHVVLFPKSKIPWVASHSVLCKMSTEEQDRFDYYKCSHRSDEKLRLETTQKWTEKRQPLNKQIHAHLNTNCLINQSPDVKFLLIMPSNKRIRHQNKTGLILVSFLVSFLLSLPRWVLIVDDENWNLTYNVINYKAAGKIIFEM